MASSTLIWQSEDKAATASVTFDRLDAYDGRYQYQWELALKDGTSVSRSDLRTPNYDLADALKSLAGFLTAWEEAWAYPNSSNGTLFPDECKRWATHYGEEFYADICAE